MNLLVDFEHGRSCQMTEQNAETCPQTDELDVAFSSSLAVADWSAEVHQRVLMKLDKYLVLVLRPEG